MCKKKLLGVVAVLATVLLIVSGCDLYMGINVTWKITGVMWPGGSYTHVTYSVQNLGKYDLTGVNLEIGVDVNGDGTYPCRAWTPDFSINQNQILYGSLDVPTGLGVNPAGWATVTSVDMDKPQG